MYLHHSLKSKILVLDLQNYDSWLPDQFLRISQWRIPFSTHYYIWHMEAKYAKVQGDNQISLWTSAPQKATPTYPIRSTDCSTQCKLMASHIAWKGGGLLTGESYQDPPSPTLPLNCLWCTCKIAQTQYDVIFSTPDSTSSDNQNLFLEAWQSSVNSAVADLWFWKGGFQFASDWSYKAREARMLGGFVAHHNTIF